jgi:Flp pilus assembly protein TadB
LYLALMFRDRRPTQDFRSMMSSTHSASMSPDGIESLGVRGKKQPNEEALARLKEEKGKKLKAKNKQTMAMKFLKAGIFSKADQERIKMLGPILGVVGSVGFLGLGLMFATMDLALAASVLGGIVGTRFPSMYLDSKIKHRDEEILYYLPLVIEQIAIGVSSSLDIGPCLGVVVKMADERGSHNVVTELLKHVQFYVKSGASLEEALDEVGSASGHTELGHSFMSLAQVSKHGGEISKQMQELADSVSSMRETKVEERIKTLELKATGPVALVFVGFMIILVAGFFIQIKVGMAKKSG